MNVAQMRDLFLDYMDDPREDRWDQAKVLRYLNVGNRHVVNALSQGPRNDLVLGSTNFSVVTQAEGVNQEEDLPTDFVEAYHVERLGSSTPTKILRTDFKNAHLEGGPFFKGIDSLESSNVYYIRGNKIGFVRPGDSFTARMWYRRTAAELVADSDTPEVPENAQDAIILHAVSLAKPSVMEQDGFRFLYNAEMDKLTQMIDRRDEEVPFTLADDL